MGSGGRAEEKRGSDDQRGADELDGGEGLAEDQRREQHRRDRLEVHEEAGSRGPDAYGGGEDTDHREA